MSINNTLATILATAIEGVRTADEERLRQLEARIAALEQGQTTAQAGEWGTPPQAGKPYGMSAKAIRKRVAAGGIRTIERTMPGAKQKKLLVHLGDLATALAGETQPTNAVAWAERRASIKKGAA